MQSLLAAWRVSLHRTRADWPIVTAAGLIALLAATLLAAGPIYSSAVSQAGLHRLLENAPVTDANIEVVGRVDTADAATTNDAVVEVLRGTIGAAGIDIVAAGLSETFTLPGQDPDNIRDLATLGFVQGVEDHATLVSGTWPAEPGPDGPIEVAVLEPIAEALGLSTGDDLPLVSRRDEDVTVPATVVGLYRPTDPADPFWWNDATLLEGLEESASYRTFGPLLTTPNALIQRVTDGSVRLTWHGYPRIQSIRISQLDGMQARLGQLSTRIGAALPGDFGTVETGLPAILEETERSLLVSRTGVLLLMAQLAILAAYAIALTADLIVDHRRLDTALMRSRGGGPLQVGALAFAEALLLALPAGLLGPWLAAAALRLFNVAGPLAGIGLEIEPAITADAYVAAGAAAIGCAVLLVMPTLLAARSYAAERSGRARQETRNLGQRLGLDIALLAVTGIALWQLRLYGAPLTRSVQGTLGLDPLLVAAPAIGILAGSVVALRLVPLLATAADALTARGRTLVTSLGARQLARRPLRYTRAALLLMLAMSMGVFAVSYATTWGSSQRDQADFLVGADLRIDPLRGPSSLPTWSLDTAYAGIDGVVTASPVERQSVRISQTAATGEVVALDATAAGSVVFLRGDQTETDLATLLQPLAKARPTIALAGIPGEPQQLAAEVTVSIEELAGLGADPETGETTLIPMPVSELDGQSTLAPIATVRDARGLLHRFPGDAVPLENGTQQVSMPLYPSSGRAQAAMQAAAASPGLPDRAGGTRRGREHSERLAGNVGRDRAGRGLGERLPRRIGPRAARPGRPRGLAAWLGTGRRRCDRFRARQPRERARHAVWRRSWRCGCRALRSPAGHGPVRAGCDRQLHPGIRSWAWSLRAAGDREPAISRDGRRGDRRSGRDADRRSRQAGPRHGRDRFVPDHRRNGPRGHRRPADARAAALRIQSRSRRPGRMVARCRGPRGGSGL